MLKFCRTMELAVTMPATDRQTFAVKPASKKYFELLHPLRSELGVKMKRILIILISALLIPVVAAGKESSRQLSIDTIQVLKIAAQDERAVIRTPDGKTQIIKPGDSLGANGKVTEIAADRVVVEEKKGNETEKVIIRLGNGKQKIERMKKTGEQAPAMYAPVKKDEKDKKQGNSVY